MKETQKKEIISDEELIARIAGGEVALFAILMKQYNQKLYRVGRGLGIPDLDLDDLIQQTYIQIYLKLPTFRGESTPSTWITRIFINECLMFLRKKRPVVSEEGTLEDFTPAITHTERTPESELLQQELRKLMESAIDKLPADYRAVYIMREVEEMSIKTIAADLDLTEANVKVRMHRARKLLQQELKKRLGPTELYKFGSARCDRIVFSVLRTIQESLSSNMGLSR